jgi:TolA-binding protein
MVKLRHLPFLLLLSALFAQCSIWDSISAYFNTFYNASRQFGEAEDELWSQPDTRFAGKNWLLVLNPPATSRAKFTAVIEKCSKLLQYHPESGLVDDALLMVAKSYFYQGDFQKTERKCKELLEGYPKSDLVTECRTLLAYVLYKEADIRTATTVAMGITADEDASDAFRGRAAMLLGQIELENHNYAPATDHFRKAAEWTNSDDLATIALLKVAEAAEDAADFASAEDAFRKAASKSSNYVGEFRGAYGAARMLAKRHEYDRALAEFAALRANVNYREFFGELDVATGDAYRDAGTYPSAIAQYKYVDTSYARSEAAAQGLFNLGQLYEKVLKNLDSARATYDRGKLAAPTSPFTGRSRERADYLGKYIQYRGEITRDDSILIAIRLLTDSLAQRRYFPDSLSDAAIDSMRKARGERMAARQDSLMEKRGFAVSELANLFYTGLDFRDSAWVWYDRLLEHHGTSQYAARGLYVLAQILQSDSGAHKQVVDSLLREVVKRFPETEFAAEARKTLGLSPVVKLRDKGDATYAVAESLMLAGEGKQALDILQDLVSSMPTAAIAPQATYAMGWIYDRQLNQPDSALSCYRRLTKRYPHSPYASRIQPILAEADLATSQSAVKKDSTVAAPAAARAQAGERALAPQTPRPDQLQPMPSPGGQMSGRESRLRERPKD